MSAPAGGTSIVWLRRDLRLRDNAALYEAASRSERICVAFIVNPPLLEAPFIGSPLVTVFFRALTALRIDLEKHGSDLAVLTGDFSASLIALARQIGATSVYFNEDYEPKAIARDLDVERALQAVGIQTHRSLDHVYFGADEIVQNGGGSYRVFTPYKRRWLDQRALAPRHPISSLPAIRGKLLPKFDIEPSAPIPLPENFGFVSSERYPDVSETIARSHLREFLAHHAAEYTLARNIPASEGTSRLSPHLRAGTIGIRTCVEAAFAECAGRTPSERASILAWISELIWRDFYQMILKVHPSVEHSPFLPAAERIAWRESDADFSAWCEGRTGYPIVDAAMRQLNDTGWMHNRLRMIAASFLTKHLLIDWRKGERYFRLHLADADLAQNNGGWQWASSTGTDAAPYFRIFNPTVQGKRFDPGGHFVKRMIPELERVPAEYIHEPWLMPSMLAAAAGVQIGKTYPDPIVNHEAARLRALDTFKRALGNS